MDFVLRRISLKRTSLLLPLLLVSLLINPVFLSSIALIDDMDITHNIVSNRATTSSDSDLIPQWSHYSDSLWCASAISSDGKTCVIADEEVVSLVDVESNVTLWTYDTESWILSVSISHNGSLIAIGTVYSQMTYVFGKASNTPLWEYECLDYVTEVEISGDGSTIVASDYSGKVLLFDHSSNATLWTYYANAQILSLSISIDGSTITAGGKNNTLFVFDRMSNSTLWTYSTDSWIMGTGVSDDGERISAVSINSLFAFGIASNSSIWAYNLNGLDGLAMSEDGSTLVAYTSGTVHPINLLVFDYSSNETLWTFNTTSQISEASVSYDGSSIAAGGYGNVTFVFDKESNQTSSEFHANGFIRSLCYSGDGQYLLMSSDLQFLSPSGVGETVLFNLTPPILDSDSTISIYYNTTMTIPVSIQVSTGSIPLAEAFLFYSSDNSTWTFISMTNSTPLSEQIVVFEASFGPFSEGHVYYYCSVNNSFGDSTESPLQEILIDGTCPVISNVKISPSTPTSNDEVTIIAEIDDELTNVTQANLTYSHDSDWISISPLQMNDTFYEWHISAMENDTTVRFYLTAVDSVGNNATSSLYFYWVFDDVGDSTTTSLTPTTSTTPTSSPTITDTGDIPIELLVLAGSVMIGLVALMVVLKKRRG